MLDKDCVFCQNDKCTCEVETLEEPNELDNPSTIPLIRKFPRMNSQDMFDWDVCGAWGC